MSRKGLNGCITIARHIHVDGQLQWSRIEEGVSREKLSNYYAIFFFTIVVPLFFWPWYFIFTERNDFYVNVVFVCFLNHHLFCISLYLTIILSCDCHNVYISLGDYNGVQIIALNALSIHHIDQQPSAQLYIYKCNLGLLK